MTNNILIPWEQGVKHPARILGNGNFIASTCKFREDEDCPSELEEANARLIVKAVNCHELLLSALKEARCQLHGNLGDLVDHFEIKHTRGVIDTVEEAISKAEGRG